MGQRTGGGVVRVKMTQPSSYPDFLAATWKEGLGWILNEHMYCLGRELSRTVEVL